MRLCAMTSMKMMVMMLRMLMVMMVIMMMRMMKSKALGPNIRQRCRDGKLSRALGRRACMLASRKTLCGDHPCVP